MLAAFEAVRPVSYRLAWDGEWHIDFASIRDAITDRTRAIVCVSPNNPTGSYLKRDELAELVRLGLPIVSDEVFGRYALEETGRRSRTALESDAELVFALGGLSKHAGLPQMKLGWIALGGSDVAVADASGRLELVADAWLSVSTPVQVAAPALLASAEVAARSIHARIAENLIDLRRATERSPVSVPRVEGGWYAVLRLPAIHDAETWCAMLLEQDGVWIHPGFLYDFEAEAFAVVSLLTRPEIFRDGVHRLVRRVEHAS
jgi:aspartate/methionine/tyrosine aminotransferase